MQPAARHHLGSDRQAGQWSVTASVAKYVAAISNPVADSSAAGGNPQTRQFIYRGAEHQRTGHDDAGRRPRRRSARCSTGSSRNGGPNLPLNGAPTIPGVTPQIAAGLSSPSAWEYASGVSRQFGGRALAARRPAGARTTCDFYMRQTDTTTGRVQDPTGRSVRPDAHHERARRSAVARLRRRHVHRHVPVRRRRSTSAATTRCRAPGAISTPRTSPAARCRSTTAYPEYKQESWNYPDRRSRGRSASSRAALGELQSALRAGPDAERAAGDRERRAVRRGRTRTAWIRGRTYESGQRVSHAAGIHDDDLLLRSARRVPHRRAAPHRPRGQLHATGSADRRGCSSSRRRRS